MADNAYTYTVWETDGTSLSEIAAEGYPAANTAADGLLCIVDKQDSAEPTQSTVPSKPGYVVEAMANWPYLTHAEAKLLVRYSQWSGAAQLYAAIFSGSNFLSSSDAYFDKEDVAFTYFGWMYLDSVAAGSVSIISKWNGTGDQRGYMVQFNDTPNQLRFLVSDDGTAGGNTTVQSTVTMSAATWYFWMAFHDPTANTIGISVNGETIVTTAHSGGVFDSSQDFEMARHSGGTYMTGREDAVGVYSKVLSQAQGDAIYNSGSGQPIGDVDSVSLDSYWKLNEESGARIDHIGSLDLTDNSSVLRTTGKILD